MVLIRLSVAWFMLTSTGIGIAMAQSQNFLARPNAHAYRRLEDIQQVNALHEAGLKGDKAMMPLLLKAVSEPSDYFRFFTAIHAIARINDPQVVPALEQALQRFAAEKNAQGYTDEEAPGYVEVARARLLADVEAHKQNNPRQQAQTRLHTFLGILQLDTASLHTAIINDKNKGYTHNPEINVRETYALRELADMIYQTRDAALTEAAKTAGINFDLDAGAKYKAQLALLSSQQRVDWIINYLANRKTGVGDDFYLMQLAADEGKLASRAAAAKLQEMDQNRQKYVIVYPDNRATPGFTAMFRVIQTVGDKEQEPIIAHFLHDKEKWINYYAEQVYSSIKDGVAWKSRIGY